MEKEFAQYTKRITSIAISKYYVLYFFLVLFTLKQVYIYIYIYTYIYIYIYIYIYTYTITTLISYLLLIY